ncbi:MAG: Phosphoglucomutase-3 [Icmadophila ericetorum]|nr:Phosphoglucomutase-3 [Icmadophila ericetorum]
MSNMMDPLVAEWLRLDKDEETRREIELLRFELNAAELERRLRPRISFGTAGLRARMEAGFARMNSLVVIQTSQGIAQYLLDHVPEATKKGVVIGYDARHNSRKFAELAAAAFIHKRIPVRWYEHIVHTPLVSFGVKFLQAVAGVMITASHNPAQDNGYKVYGKDGCQINSPADDLITASIMDNLEPATWKIEDDSLRDNVLEEVKSAYFGTMIETVVKLPPDLKALPRFIYTPLHGVGLEYMTAALEKIELSNGSIHGDKETATKYMTVEKSQAKPDPSFPTVEYPNPEEKGALDLAMKTADSQGINLVIANDPDADRFAAAEKVDGAWHQFTGDQMGVLLGYYVFEARLHDGPRPIVMLVSAVSSQMLVAIAHTEGFLVQETLTGFKWLGNRAAEVARDGEIEVCFAYEEALGYMVPKVVYDKDGISAALLFLGLCVKCGSPLKLMNSLYKAYGYFEVMNTYWKSPNAATTKRVFQDIRGLGGPFPEKKGDKFGDRKIVRWRDLTNGYDSLTLDHFPELPTSAATEMITCWLDGTNTDKGIRFTIRASGTEPKIKVYLECRSDTANCAKSGAIGVLRLLEREFFSDPSLVMEQKFDLS